MPLPLHELILAERAKDGEIPPDIPTEAPLLYDVLKELPCNGVALP